MTPRGYGRMHAARERQCETARCPVLPRGRRVRGQGGLRATRPGGRRRPRRVPRVGAGLPFAVRRGRTCRGRRRQRGGSGRAVDAQREAGGRPRVAVVAKALVRPQMDHRSRWMPARLSRSIPAGPPSCDIEKATRAAVTPAGGREEGCRRTGSFSGPDTRATRPWERDCRGSASRDWARRLLKIGLYECAVRRGVWRSAPRRGSGGLAPREPRAGRHPRHHPVDPERAPAGAVAHLTFPTCGPLTLQLRTEGVRNGF